MKYVLSNDEIVKAICFYMVDRVIKENATLRGELKQDGGNITAEIEVLPWDDEAPTVKLPHES